MLKHRNSQKRIIFEDAIYFVTSKTFNNFPYFRERIFCDLFIENLRLCKLLKGFLLYGWVLIYDHFHLLIQPGDKWDISKIMQFLKRHVSRNLNIIMGYDNRVGQTPIIPEGGIGQCRLRAGRTVTEHDHEIRAGRTVINRNHETRMGPIGVKRERESGDVRPVVKRDNQKLIHELHKFDKFVQILRIRFKLKYPNGHPFPRFQWKESFHDHYIRNDRDFNDKLDYIAWNPDKHGLPSDWPYVFTIPKYENLIDDI